MINTYLVLELILLHLFADFVLQTDSMALNKNHSNKWLSIHILVYMIPFLILGWKFALINGAAHFITDYISSRICTKLWQKQNRYGFFVVIGIDQAVHLSTLVITAGYLL